MMGSVKEPLGRWTPLLAPLPDHFDWPDTLGRSLMTLLLLVWGFSHMSLSVEDGAMNSTFMHRVHLVIHEAGHLVFIPMGRFITIAGGTLLQLIMPAAFLVSFLFQYQNAFGAAGALWWLGDSFLDVAPYAYDGRAMKLMLLGGVTGHESGGHDWNNMLGDLGLINSAPTVGMFFWFVGVILILVSLAWLGLLLTMQLEALQARSRQLR